MQLLTPLVPDPGAPLGRANPVAKLVAALALLIVLFASLDGVTGDRYGHLVQTVFIQSLIYFGVEGELSGSEKLS